MAEEMSMEGGDVMEDDELTQRLREQGTIDENTMVIIQQDGDEESGHMSIEQSIALNGGERTIQMSAAELAESGYTITTTDNGETYISSPDGQILTQVSAGGEEPQQHDYNVEDDAQLLLQDANAAAAMASNPTAGQMVIGDEPEEPETVGGMMGEFQNLIVQHMDISEPLTTLQKLLEARLHCSLKTHEFYLQDSLQLDIKKNLTTQCVQGSGMVQINVEVKSSPGLGCKPRLNIVDILKPADDAVEESTLQQQQQRQQATTLQPAPPRAQKLKPKVVIPLSEENENVTRWIVDQNFRREQERLGIPQEPSLWDESHVNHWIQWAISEFKLEHVQPEVFANITGKDLVEMKHEEFSRLVVNDKGDIFWTHLELLRKCRFVAVIQQPTPHAITTITVSSSDPLNIRSFPPLFCCSSHPAAHATCHHHHHSVQL